MTTSEQIGDLAAALAKAQAEMEGASKDSANPFFKSKYADLASVWAACRGPLTKHGLSVVQFPKVAYEGQPEPYEWTSKQGEKRYGVRVVAVVRPSTRLLHLSGQWLEDAVSTMLPTGDPQSIGSAITYLRRYSLQSVAGIAPEDDDAEKAHQPMNQPPASAVPTGYQDWLDDLMLVAEEGTTRLEKAWTGSKKEYRQHLTSTAPALWSQMKKKAAQQDVPAVVR